MTLALFQNQTLPARRPSEDARQYAYRIIRKFILELHLLPGQKMNEADLASSLNMSRTPIHDSFFKLSRENLVDVIPKRTSGFLWKCGRSAAAVCDNGGPAV